MKGQKEECFKGTQDLFESNMIGHIDMEITFMKKEICYTHRSLETGGVAHHAGPQKKVPESIRSGGREKENVAGQELFLWFPWERLGKAG